MGNNPTLITPSYVQYLFVHILIQSKQFFALLVQVCTYYRWICASVPIDKIRWETSGLSKQQWGMCYDHPINKANTLRWVMWHLCDNYSYGLCVCHIEIVFLIKRCACDVWGCVCTGYMSLLANWLSSWVNLLIMCVWEDTAVQSHFAADAGSLYCHGGCFKSKSCDGKTPACRFG